MTDQEIINKLAYQNCIYGFMYGEPTICCGLDQYRPDRIIKIDASSLYLGKSGRSFVYEWGHPGPDYNIYYFDDYGRTWAFTEEEIG